MTSEEYNQLPSMYSITLSDVHKAKETLIMLRSADSFHVFNDEIHWALGIAIQELKKTELIWSGEELEDE